MACLRPIGPDDAEAAPGAGAEGCGCRCHDERRAVDRLRCEALLRDLLTTGRLPLHRAWWVDTVLRRPHSPCAFAVVTTAGPRSGHLARVVEAALRRRDEPTSEPLSIAVDDVVVALVPEDVNGGVAAFCDDVMAGAAEARLSVRGGVGPPSREPSEYVEGLRRARWVIEVLSATGGGDWATFDALGVYAILFELEGAGPDGFVARRLGPLLRYDEERRSDLVGTLQCLLDAGGVITKAADQLFVHISTFKYRLRRIQDLLGGVDLRDPQVAFDLHLALKILWVRQHRACLDGATTP